MPGICGCGLKGACDGNATSAGVSVVDKVGDKTGVVKWMKSE